MHAGNIMKCKCLLFMYLPSLQWRPSPFSQYLNCLLIVFAFSQGCELTDITCLQEYIHLQTVILSHNSLTGEWKLPSWTWKFCFTCIFCFGSFVLYFIYLGHFRSVNRSHCTNRFKSIGLYALSGDTWCLAQWTHHCFRLQASSWSKGKRNAGMLTNFNYLSP